MKLELVVGAKGQTSGKLTARVGSGIIQAWAGSSTCAILAPELNGEETGPLAEAKDFLSSATIRDSEVREG